MIKYYPDPSNSKLISDSFHHHSKLWKSDNSDIAVTVDGSGNVEVRSRLCVHENAPHVFNNTSVPVLTIERTTTGVVTSDFGASVDFKLYNNETSVLTSRIASTWDSDLTNSERATNLTFYVNDLGGNLVSPLQLDWSGFRVALNGTTMYYGSTFTGGFFKLYDSSTYSELKNLDFVVSEFSVLATTSSFTGNVGIGTSTPDKKLHVKKESTGTNDVESIFKLELLSTGIIATGFGVGMDFFLDDACYSCLAGKINCVWSDVSEFNSELSFSTLKDKNEFEILKMNSDVFIARSNSYWFTNSDDNSALYASFSSGAWTLQARDTSAPVPLTIWGSPLRFKSGYSSDTLFLDARGNLGLGVTPQAWHASYRAVEIGSRGALMSPASAGNYFYMMQNAYYDSTNWKYYAAAATSLYTLGGGNFYWETAGAGTVGGTISWSEKMRLSVTGMLGLSRTNPLERIHLDCLAAEAGTFLGFDCDTINKPRGIKFWANSYGTNWGIYGANSNTAAASLDGTTSLQWAAATGHYIYLRIPNNTANAFVFENASKALLVGIRGDGITHIEKSLGFGKQSVSISSSSTNITPTSTRIELTHTNNNSKTIVLQAGSLLEGTIIIICNLFSAYYSQVTVSGVAMDVTLIPGEALMCVKTSLGWNAIKHG